MKSSLLQRTAEVILALTAAVLLVLTILPPSFQVPDPPRSTHKAMPTGVLPPAMVVSVPVDQIAILGLFGVSQAAPAVPAPAAPKGPVDASWMSFIGYVTPTNGAPYYIFKDGRSNGVIKVTEGKSMDGWSVVEVANDHIVLRYLKDLYSVVRR